MFTKHCSFPSHYSVKKKQQLFENSGNHIKKQRKYGKRICLMAGQCQKREQHQKKVRRWKTARLKNGGIAVRTIICPYRQRTMRRWKAGTMKARETVIKGMAVMRQPQEESRKCPSCGKKVVHLPRHLRNVHDWNKACAKSATVRFKLRKTYTFQSEETAKSGNRVHKKADPLKKPKPCRRKKMCPLTGCATITERLPQHLQKVHKLARTDPIYKRTMSAARMASREEDRMKRKEKLSSVGRRVDEHESTESENDDEPGLLDPNIKDRASSDAEVAEFNTSEPGEDIEEILCLQLQV